MCTRGRGRQGARAIMMWSWLERVDFVVARAGLFGLQGMLIGMLGDVSVWYGDVKHCGVSTPHSHSHARCHWLCVLCGCTRQSNR